MVRVVRPWCCKSWRKRLLRGNNWEWDDLGYFGAIAVKRGFILCLQPGNGQMVSFVTGCLQLLEMERMKTLTVGSKR